ncbi:MAG: hypothetical protein Q8P77_02020 [Candidatus Veblenbacteria bacterium]|nr:hypothetical protein [Candidatus Veblenbacteria bacterium]
MSSIEYLKRFPHAKLFSGEYRRKVSNSAKKRFLDDPTLREKVASRTFDFVKNKKLAPLLKRDYKSAKICLKYSLWKPSIILYGSIIEAILMEKFPKARDFYRALETSYREGVISEKQYHQIHMVRDLRNFVHLHKELSEDSEINEYWARTFADICESIIKRFRR